MPEPNLTVELIDAYLDTNYRIFAPDGIISVRPNSISTPLCKLLKTRGVRSCALLTAFNPRSQPTESDENIRRQHELEQEVLDRWEILRAEGVDRKGDWPAEQSALILGIEFNEAVTLGRTYAQNAFVFCDAAGYVSLVASLTIRTSPGGIRWTRQPDGSYSFVSFVLGGNGSGITDAQSIAERIYRRQAQNLSTILPVLHRLGWIDVVDRIEELDKASLPNEITRQDGKSSAGSSKWPERLGRQNALMHSRTGEIEDDDELERTNDQMRGRPNLIEGTFVIDQNGTVLCPACSIELDEAGRCRNCWGDVFGLCEACGEILSEDQTCSECG